MKFTMEAREIKKLIQTLAPLKSKMQDAVKITALKSTVKFYSATSGGQVSITARAEADVIEKGDATVSYSFLKDAPKGCKASEVITLETAYKTLHILGARNTWLTISNPLSSTYRGKTEITFRLGIQAAIAKALPFAGGDEYRLEVAGVALQCCAERLYAIGTDGRQLKAVSLKAKGVPDFNITIPPTACMAICKLPNSPIKVEIGAGVRFESGGVRIDSSTRDDYPEWQLVEVGSAAVVKFNRQAAIDALMPIAKMEPRGHSDAIPVRWTVAGGTAKIECGEFGSAIAAEGSRLVICFNSLFLLNLLNSIDSEEVTMKTRGRLYSTGFYGDNEDKTVLMPMNIERWEETVYGKRNREAGL